MTATVVRLDPSIQQLDVATLEGTRSDEQFMHERFDSLRLHGEWFSPGQQLLELIYELVSAGGAVAT